MNLSTILLALNFLGLSSCSTSKMYQDADHVKLTRELPDGNCKSLGVVMGQGKSLFSVVSAGREAYVALRAKAYELGGNYVVPLEDNSSFGELQRNELSFKPIVIAEGKAYRCQ